MTRRLLAIAFMCAACICAGTLNAAAAPVPCGQLATLSLPDATVTAAQDVPAGEYIPPQGPKQKDLPAFCRVAVTVMPQIRIEVWLPTDTWNGRYRGEGGGGYAGQMSYAGLAAGVRDGYATASTDTGHPASAGGTFALNPDGSLNTQLITDFAERSLRELAAKTKAIIKAYYGTMPKYSYWNGCSTGGRQGLVAAQRFPEEYDGMVIGAPAINWDRFIPAELWPQIAINTTVGRPITAAKLTAVTTAAIAACDANDGVSDGVIDDPRTCTYDPAALTCRNGEDTGSCLTPQEVDAVRKIWNGPTDSSGARLWFGLERGAPLTALAGAKPFPIATAHFQYWTRQDPNADWHALREADFADYLRASEAKFHDVIGTDDPNLGGFRRHGGKMIMWHGEADQLIFPRGTINYYERVVAANAGAQPVSDFVRLFMAPGVEHCGGGEGPMPEGMFEAMVNWVEHGVAPATITARRTRDDGTSMTRPLCAFPSTAKWRGSGSTDDAANFTCVDGQQRTEDFRVADPVRK